MEKARIDFGRIIVEAAGLFVEKSSGYIYDREFEGHTCKYHALQVLGFHQDVEVYIFYNSEFVAIMDGKYEWRGSIIEHLERAVIKTTRKFDGNEWKEIEKIKLPYDDFKTLKDYAIMIAEAVGLDVVSRNGVSWVCKDVDGEPCNYFKLKVWGFSTPCEVFIFAGGEYKAVIDGNFKWFGQIYTDDERVFVNNLWEWRQRELGQWEWVEPDELNIPRFGEKERG